jgi:hypothetical protein
MRINDKQITLLRFRLKTLKLHLTLCYQTFISFEKSKTKIQKGTLKITILQHQI